MGIKTIMKTTSLFVALSLAFFIIAGPVFARGASQADLAKQAQNLTAAGAVGGTFWGMLVGMIFLNPLVGAAVGAGAGALSGKLRDIGISDDFMKELGETITAGSSALFVLVRKATPDKVLEELKGFKGKVLKTSLEKDKEEEIREVLEQA